MTNSLLRSSQFTHLSKGFYGLKTKWEDGRKARREEAKERLDKRVREVWVEPSLPPSPSSPLPAIISGRAPSPTSRTPASSTPPRSATKPAHERYALPKFEPSVDRPQPRTLEDLGVPGWIRDEMRGRFGDIVESSDVESSVRTPLRQSSTALVPAAQSVSRGPEGDGVMFEPLTAPAIVIGVEKNVLTMPRKSGIWLSPVVETAPSMDTTGSDSDESDVDRDDDGRGERLVP